MKKYYFDAFIAGAEKAGTTSLAYYMAQHPDVLCHVRPESMGGTQVIEFSSFINGRSENLNQFEQDFNAAFSGPPSDEKIILGKNVDIINHQTGAKNLHAHSPDCKIIVSLRHPVDRAYSSFWYQHYRGEETCSTFEEVLEMEMNPSRRKELSRHRLYLGRSDYASHLVMLDEIFGAKNVLPIIFEDLKSSTQPVVDEVFQFLCLPPCDILDARVRNKSKMIKFNSLARFIHQPSSYKSFAKTLMGPRVRRRFKTWLRKFNSVEMGPPPMAPTTRKLLLEYFEPCVATVEMRLDRKLNIWRR